MIRPARQSDAAALGMVYARAWKTGYKGLLPDFFLDILTDETCAPKPDHIAPDHRLVAEQEGVMGTVTFDKGEIRSLYVLPEYWGRGVAAGLFAAAVDGLKGQGYDTVTLWVYADSARARRFFEKMGMVLTGEKRDTEMAGTLLTEVQYQL